MVEHRRLGQLRHAIEMGGVAGSDVPGSIETGRWYDIRIEVKGANIKCFLDGKLIHDLSCRRPSRFTPWPAWPRARTRSSSKSSTSRHTDQETDIRLKGAKIRPTATAIVLTSDKPEDENTLDQPTGSGRSR